MSINFNKRNIGIKNSIQSQINSHEHPIVLKLEFNDNDTKKDNFNLNYVKKYISAISKKYPYIDIKYEITYVKYNDFHLGDNKCRTLDEINNYLIDTGNYELLIRKQNELSRSFTFQSVISANRKLEKIIQRVNNVKEKYLNMSTFETFMLIYEEVTNLIYKEEKRYDQLNASHWISVLNGDSIVCTGYASLMQELTQRIFNGKDVLVLENDVDVYDKSKNDLISAHASNIIFIRDNKYNINGLFYLDPCLDSVETNDEIKAYSYCCTPLKDIDHHKLFTFYFRTIYQYNLAAIYKNFFNINISKNATLKNLMSKSMASDILTEDMNSLHYYINHYDSLDNKSIVPLIAYINSFKIIGENKGLKSNELNEFVKSRIEKSIAKTMNFFHAADCNNAFSKELIKKQKNLILDNKRYQ